MILFGHIMLQPTNPFVALLGHAHTWAQNPQLAAGASNTLAQRRFVFARG